MLLLCFCFPCIFVLKMTFSGWLAIKVVPFIKRIGQNSQSVVFYDSSIWLIDVSKCRVLPLHCLFLWKIFSIFMFLSWILVYAWFSDVFLMKHFRSHKTSNWEFNYCYLFPHLSIYSLNFFKWAETHRYKPYWTNTSTTKKWVCKYMKGQSNIGSTLLPFFQYY